MVWEILKNGDLTPFMEIFHSRKLEVTRLFHKRWNQGMLEIFGRTFTINIEHLFSKVVGILIVQIFFYRDGKISDSVVEDFPIDEDQCVSLNKGGKTYYHP